MPPHEDITITPHITYAANADDLFTVTRGTGRTEPGFYLDDLYHATAARPITGAPITINETAWTMPKFVTEEDLQKVIKKIYNIITDHTTLDISEEEFMSMLKDNNNE